MPFFTFRFVTPSGMTEQQINEYIEGKYGKFGVDRYETSSTFCLLF